jgi:5-methylcytosine-specific restriction endonuclease McrA
MCHSDLDTKNSKYRRQTYNYRFGSWRKALEAFVKYINNDKMENNGISTEIIVSNNDNSSKVVHSTKRDISERLRFKILLRDGFTCKKCGSSPLKSIGVELHVDHIIPWSKGGETVPENLETKCLECNLGKGNAYNV